MDILRSPMNLHRLTIAFVLVACMAAAGRNQGFPLPAAELMNQVVANELTDRAAAEVDVSDRQARRKADPYGRAGGH